MHQPSTYVTDQVPNPFQSFSTNTIATVEFYSQSTTNGLLFIIKDRTEIGELYRLAAELENKRMLLGACGDLAWVKFKNSRGRPLADFFVLRDAKTISVQNPKIKGDTGGCGTSKELALKCFDLMLKYSPAELRQLKNSQNGCTKEHLVPNFPFETVK